MFMLVVDPDDYVFNGGQSGPASTACFNTSPRRLRALVAVMVVLIVPVPSDLNHWLAVTRCREYCFCCK